MNRIVVLILLLGSIGNNLLAQTAYKAKLVNDNLVISSMGKDYKFSISFTVLYAEKDPNMAFRRSGIGIEYNVLSWKTYQGKKNDLKQTKVAASMAGDGFDDKILKGDQLGRTVNLFNASEVINLSAANSEMKGKDTIVFSFPSHALFELHAFMVLSKDKYPVVQYTLKPLVDGYFSVGYTGAPASNLNEINGLWQPMVWHNKKFPDNSYLTPSYLAPLPTTLTNDGTNTLGILAASKYLPFNPLPLLVNSQFGVSVRSIDGLVKNQIFAPLLGGLNSKMVKNSQFNFQFSLVVEPLEMTYAYEKIARKYFGFKDSRRNDIATLNQTLENIVDYAVSDKTWFVDSLKGYAYSTDVPGAVKNVSSLNPTELSLVMDDQKMFEKRTYPLTEYVLSRQDLLFSLDSTQKIQNPSRKLKGPVARVSELLSLYSIWNNPVYLELAEKKAGIVKNGKEILKLGKSWVNAMYLYKATGKTIFLDQAISGANNYLNDLEENKKKQGSLRGFFWTSFTNDWMVLLELYEITKDKRYLNVAHEGARQFTMITWMSPAIPDSLVTVNKDGKAPMYWYLENKGHKQIYYPEEKVEAWRLSEIGLTSESSGTSTGHRAIFMANYAPWMLRIGYHTNDTFLKEVAKSAIIGRYRNFPGYHINTARTTAYEKFDFPFHSFENQSVSSFHYNHILPMASMLLDYLVSDAYVRAKGEIDFPSEYIEGYAYLQNKLYGKKKGRFYNEKDIQLWMPAKLLKTENVELNYISGRKGNSIFIAFMNQSAQPVNSTITLNEKLLNSIGAGMSYSVYKENHWAAAEKIGRNQFNIKVAQNGLTVIRIDHLNPIVKIQDQLTAEIKPLANDFQSIEMGKAKAMLFQFGAYTAKAFVYLEDDDNVFSEVSMHFTLPGKKEITLTDKSYPFEFTVNLDQKEPYILFTLEGTKRDGTKVRSTSVTLGRQSAITNESLIEASQAGALPVYFKPLLDTKVKPGSFNHPQELIKREGLPNYFNKARNAKPITVGYIGGSITRANDMYRMQSSAFIQQMFPKTPMKFINAGVAGSDTDLGTFRIYDHLLQYNPDLIFIEFAVNGGFMQGMEGMIRQIWKHNPKTDICLVYTVTSAQLASYSRGQIPEGIKKLERIADYYHIPSIHMATEASMLLKDDELLAKGDANRSDKKIVFSIDGVHPTKQGGDLYASAIARSINSLVEAGKVFPHPLIAPLLKDNWEDARMYAPKEIATFSKDWKDISPVNNERLKQFAEWFPYVTTASKLGESFSFKFEGNAVGLFDIGGPEVGQLEIKIDGKPVKFDKIAGSKALKAVKADSASALNRFNVFCNNRYRGQYVLIETEPGIHQVTFTISPEIPDKVKILGESQLKDITAFPEKYNQSVIYIGKILVRGKILSK